MKAVKYLFIRIIQASILTFIVSNASAQWINKGTNPNQYIRNLSFPSNSIGYAIMDDSGTAVTTFHKTENAGNSWQEIALQSNVFSTADIIDIHFPSINVGYIVFRAFTPNLEARVFRSGNAGKSWQDVSPPSMNLGSGHMDVYFINDDSGFVFSGNTLYRTLNAGQNWTLDSFTVHGGPTEFDFNQNHHGIMGGWDGSFLYRGYIYYTSDFGSNWDTLDLKTVQSQVFEVELTDNNTAYALSGGNFNSGPTLYKTSNGGMQWDSTNLPFIYDSLDQVSDMLFVTDQKGYLCTNKGYIYETLNGADSWTVSHFEKPALDVLASNKLSVFCSGPLNTLLTLDLFSSTAEIAEENSLLLYPNPLNKQEDLHLAIEVTGRVELIDVSSRLCGSWTLNGSNKISINDANLKPGLYYLKIEDKGVFKLMIQ